ncbi:gibberellin 20 oxidase 3-like [Apium graveolens]|uniref:gibberellin 20 oxidase 3-like n=1 Tax=Apium graveolens TaxID=4045 RepID=UPI003D7BA49E
MHSILFVKKKPHFGRTCHNTILVVSFIKTYIAILSNGFNINFFSNSASVFFPKDQNLEHTKFTWPKEDLIQAQEEPNAQVIDLVGFLSNDKAAAAATAKVLHAACMDRGFFQVTNHGVDEAIIQVTHDEIDTLFDIPMDEKLRLSRRGGSIWGYYGAHADRFVKNLSSRRLTRLDLIMPVGRRLLLTTLILSVDGGIWDTMVHALMPVYQKYCEQINKLAIKILKLLEVSLGVEAEQNYRKLFEEGTSIMRCNYYLKCDQPELVLGTGPHADPTAITILHQDQVGGLQVFSENKWKYVLPCPDALVVNIALSNGMYKSCVHRAVVNSERIRRSMVYFVCPKEDLVLRAPEKIVEADGGKRKYLDFKWADLCNFIHNHHRVHGTATLDNFSRCLPPSPAN